MHTRSVLGSIGRSLGLVAAAGTVPSPMASAAAPAAPVIQRGAAPASTGTPKASADDSAKEMTEEELEQKYPEAMKKIKAKAAAQAAAEAAKAAMEAAPKEEEKAEAKAKATASTGAAVAATVGELKAAFPDDPAFCFTCIEQGLSMHDALVAKVKAQSEQLAALQSGRAKPAGTPAASASTQTPSIPSSAALAASGNVPTQFATFDEAMTHEMAQARAAGTPITKGQALVNCQRKYPELHAEKFLAGRK